jgi:hypothetical protein
MRSPAEAIIIMPRVAKKQQAVVLAEVLLLHRDVAEGDQDGEHEGDEEDELEEGAVAVRNVHAVEGNARVAEEAVAHHGGRGDGEHAHQFLLPDEEVQYEDNQGRRGHDYFGQDGPEVRELVHAASFSSIRGIRKNAVVYTGRET